MIDNLPAIVKNKYAHIFDEKEGMHRVATINNDYILPGYPVIKLSGIYDRFGFIDTKGKEVVPPEYISANDYCDEMALVVTIERKKYFINTIGVRVIDLQKFQDVFDFSNKLACVKIHDKYGFIDITGKQVIPILFDNVIGRQGCFFNSNGIMGVSINGKYGVINRVGQFIHKAEYDLLEFNWIDLTDPYITLYRNGKKTFLNESGEIISTL